MTVSIHTAYVSADTAAVACTTAQPPAPHAQRSIRSGRPRKLSAQQDRQVVRLIDAKRPDHYGFGSGLWTRQTVQQLLLARFQVSLSLLSVSKMLQRLGLVLPHQPQRGAMLADLTRHTCADVLFLCTNQPVAADLQPLVSADNAEYGLYACNLLGAFWYASCPGPIGAAKLTVLLKRMMRGRLRPVTLVLDGCPAEWTAAATACASSMLGRLVVALPAAVDTQAKE